MRFRALWRISRKSWGPVAQTIAKEVASRLKIMKGDKISPSTQAEYDKLLAALEIEYSKIIGKELAKNIMKM